MLSAFHINWTCPFFARTPDRPYAVEPFELLAENQRLHPHDLRQHRQAIL